MVKSTINPPSASDLPNQTVPRSWLVWGLAALFFLVDYFARVAPSVMTADLMRAFHVTAFLLGGLSSFFYWPYVFMQLPVGMLVDKFGPKRLLTVATLFCAVACMWFAMATHIFSASGARALLGFASAFAFVGALKLGSLWFAPRQFGLIAGTTQALGMLGASFGQAPMAYLVEMFGWRDTMFGISGLFILLLVLIGFLVKDHPHNFHPAQSAQAHMGLLKNLGQVVRNPQSWWNGLYAGFLYAPTAALGELWGASFLSRAYDVPYTQAALGTMLIFVGWGIGGPFAGWLSDRLGHRRPVLIASSLLSLIVLSFIIYFPSQSFVVTAIALFIYGVVNTGVGVAYAVASEINPHRNAGTSLAFANMASIMVGGALMQPIVGKLLDWHWSGLIRDGIPYYSTAEFRSALVILPACLVISLIFAFKIKETHCVARM